VLRGLRAIGEDMTQDGYCARDWLESCQNNEWRVGETCGTYENPSTKGIGESTASQTAWAIMGSVHAAISIAQAFSGFALLLRSQNRRSWDEGANHRTGFPGVFYLKYDMYRQISAARTRVYVNIAAAWRSPISIVVVRATAGGGWYVVDDDLSFPVC